MPDETNNPAGADKSKVVGPPPPPQGGTVAAGDGADKPGKSAGSGLFFLRDKRIQENILSFIVILGLAFVVIIIWKLRGEDDLFGKLRDGAYARGMITFLVAIASIGLCFILVMHSLFSGEGNKDESFRRAREVLGLLTGILGTIVGFYFGTTEKAGPELQVAEVQAEARAGGGTNTWDLATFVSGGSPPYRYSITFSPAKDKTGSAPAGVTNQLTENGWIKARFTATNALSVSLEVLDKNDRRKTVEKKLNAQAGTP